MSGDNLQVGEDISILLSAFPRLGLATIQSVVQMHDGDQEHAIETLLAINKVLEREVAIHRVCLNRQQFPLAFLDLTFLCTILQGTTY
jgi:CUE domain